MGLCLNPGCLKPNPDQNRYCMACGASLLLASRYQAVKVLGQGGFGRTFLAVDTHLPSLPQCVIKQFLPQIQGTEGLRKASAMFAEEAKHLENLGKQTAQIPTLLAYFTEDKRQYLIQEFIDGLTLEQWPKEYGLLSEDEIWYVLKQLLLVLKIVHSNNIIHRDIKPANIIYRPANKDLVLVDFGVSKIVDPSLGTRTGTQVSSAGYTAPEQIMGKARYASDLYSLGTTCLELLTGKSPIDLYDFDEAEWQWQKHLMGKKVSLELAQILNKLVAYQLKSRYQTAEEAYQDVNNLYLKKEGSQSSPKASNPTQSNIQPSPQTSNQVSKLQVDEFTFESVTVNRKGEVIKRTPGRAYYYRENLGSGIYLDMVYIAGGAFLMGSPEIEDKLDPWRESHKPQHWVTVPSLWMGKYQVTQAQWQAIMGYNPAHFKGDNSPIDSVNWYICEDFCQKLSERTGKRYRLPSEAEWEYVCRAGTKTPFHCGETITVELANYNGNVTYADEVMERYREQTVTVGSFPPNGWGLYDMHGNVLEWCEDGWHDNYQGAPTDGSAWNNNYKSPNRRVLRGGSWLHGPQFCRSISRAALDCFSHYDNLGLRLAIACGKT